MITDRVLVLCMMASHKRTHVKQNHDFVVTTNVPGVLTLLPASLPVGVGGCEEPGVLRSSPLLSDTPAPSCSAPAVTAPAVVAAAAAFAWRFFSRRISFVRCAFS